MIYKRYASDFMTPEVIVGSRTNTFNQLLKFFTAYKIQHLPIVDEGNLVGILSVNDVIRFLEEKLSEGKALNANVLDYLFKVDEVMTPNPVSVSPHASQREILDILGEGKFQAIPVVEGKSLVGIITNKDIARVYQYDASHVI